MAVPVALTGRLFYWNKTTFDEVGVALPTDEASLFAAGEAFKAYNEDYYPLALSEYDRMIFLVYYLESVYGKPWVENGEVQYTEEEIATGMDFINKLEDGHVIPTLATINGDMADSLDKNAKWIDGKYAGIFEWDSSASKFQKAVVESTNKPNQEFVIGDFIKFGDYNGGFTKISMGLAVSANSAHPKEAAMLINYLLNDPEGIEICATERGIPCSAAAKTVLDEKNLGNALVKEANAKVMDHSKFPLDSKFEHNDLKANPDGVYYKVFGKLSSDDYDAAAAAKARRRAVPHLRPRGQRVGRSGLFCRAEPPASTRFWKLLETFYGSRTPPCPRKQKFFRKNGNFFEKHLFIGEKIGYNKKQTPPHAAARYQQRGRRAGCACENHHSLQNF